MAHPAPSPDLVPRRLVLAAGAAAAASVVAVGALRRSGFEAADPVSPVRAERALRFVDEAGGTLAVIDAGSGRTLERLQGEQGFVRGVLRGLLRERKRAGQGSDAPVLLRAHADGRLSLADPATGERIELDSFGSANATHFARWLPPTPQVKP